MRKITSLVLMLLCAVTTMFAQTLPATNKAFTVVAEGHNSGVKPGWAINNEKTAMVSFGNTTISNNDQKNFAFVQYDNKVYLYSVWAQKFVQKDMSLSDALPIDDIKVEILNSGKFYFKYDDAHNMNIGGSKQLAPDGWNILDGGNQYTLTEVADFDPTAALAILSNSCTITYNFKYNGQVVATQTTEVTKGARYPAFTSLPWGAVAPVPTGTANEDKTFEIECTVDTSVLPFVPSATYGDANMKWYYLKFHSDNGYYLHHDEGQDHIDLRSTSIDNTNKDAYAWAFIGNPFDGYKIVNRAKGNGYILSSSTTMAGTTGSDTWPIMTNEENLPEGNNTYWIPTSSSHHTNGFFLAQKDYPDNRMNDRGKLAYWTAGVGSGSTFWVEECPIEITYNFTYNGQTIGTQIVNTFVGEEYPNITVSFPFGVSATKPKGTITAGADRFVTIAVEVNLPFEYYDDYAAVEAANGWYNLIMHSNWNTGSGAVRYRTYLSHAEGGSTLAWGTERSLTNPGAAYYWAFVGNPITGFRVVNKAKGDGYVLSSNGTANPLMLEETALEDGYNTTWQIAERKYNVSQEGDYVLEGAWFCLKHTNGQYINANAGNGNVAFWTDNDNGSGILAVKPLVINEAADYATFYSDNYVMMPSTIMDAEVNCYYVNKVEDGYAKFGEISGEVIPAKTGVVVKYATESDVVYAPEITSKGETADIEGNLLKGTTKRTLITKEANNAYYALGLTDGIGFYNAVNGENEGEFYNNAFKAYLFIPGASGSASLRFDFGGITTGVEEVETEVAETVIYDLTGRRVNEITKAGVYVVNGRKVLVK